MKFPATVANLDKGVSTDRMGPLDSNVPNPGGGSWRTEWALSKGQGLSIGQIGPGSQGGGLGCIFRDFPSAPRPLGPSAPRPRTEHRTDPQKPHYKISFSAKISKIENSDFFFLYIAPLTPDQPPFKAAIYV